MSNESPSPAIPAEEPAAARPYDAELMRRLIGYLRPYWPMAATAVALIVFSSLLQLVGPLATAVALDLWVGDAAGPGGEISAVSRWVETFLARVAPGLTDQEGLILVGGVYLAALLLTFGVLYLQALLMNVMGQFIMRDLRHSIFAKLQRLPVAFFDRRPVGRLVTRVTNDVDALNELFTAGLVSIFGDIVLLGGIVCVLFAFSWRLALVTFAILPFLFLLTFWFKLRARQSYREVREKLAAINSFLQEHIGGMAIVQLFNRERQALGEFEEINDAHRVANIRAIFYYAVYYPAVELITSVGVALVLWYGGGRVMAGALSLGALVAFLQYAQRFYRPLADLSEKYNILQAAMAASERIFELLDHEVELESAASGFKPASVRGEISFAGVTFGYLEGEPVLHDVSFEVHSGETVAIVGHTGAGKSTLAALLQRFYDVDTGRVEVDGIDVRDWDLERLRRSVGVVLQDVFLFSGSLADNIRLGDDRIDGERLRWAAREVQALDFIERLDGGFEAVVRERGAGLSVGQKQLVSFARALAFDPEILVLDEATSSIDSDTEQRIQIGLDKLLANRTSLVIAHRLSTIRRADRILVLHKGRLAEEGTHEQLLERRGIYYRLHLLQYGTRAA